VQMTVEKLNDLMRGVAAGDREAFASLYAATSAKLYGIVLRILKRPDLTDEVVQETYMRIWTRAASFDPAKASPITWMAAIARNRALDEVRRVTPSSLEDLPAALEIADTALLASEQLVHRSDLVRLHHCLDALDPQRRDIVKLAYLEGCSREELGQRFGHPAATIKTWLRRSLLQLKTCLSS
jgi:RNA polymerase sigma-70 factor, ECF subfamily